MVNKEKPNNRREIIEKNVFNRIEWQDDITVLDLSNREIRNFDENVELPANLVVLNLSNNNFKEVPKTVLRLNHLKTLDLSLNSIVLFDETPNFCHSLERLNISKNKLKRPPYWVWAEQPQNLVYLILNDNENLCQSMVDYYLEELLQFTSLVNVIDLFNCKLGRHMKLMSTFKYARVVNLGTADYRYLSMNHVENVPCVGLEDCCDVEVLNLCNTNIYNIQHNIDIYKNLVEINLSENYIHSLPNEFCNLENLEICILSSNKILYLPDNIHQLKKLTKLYLNDNVLCMLPESLQELKSLKIVDLYNNHLYEGLADITHLEQYDFAQNYADEPENDEYLEKKRKLRDCSASRHDGRAPETVFPENESEQDSKSVFEEDTSQSELQEAENSRCSSPEDWDSDDHWIPSYIDIPNHSNPQQSQTYTTMQWLDFVRRKMAEGNFCPMDMHLTISITEQVKYEKLNNPQPQYESDGQFDDLSGDET